MLPECIDPEDFGEIEGVERDAHGHVRLAEIPFGSVLKRRVRRGLSEIGYEITIVDKNIGYELRCCAPVANDLEYTRDLGSGAVRALRDGQRSALICIDRSVLTPLPLKSLLNEETRRMSVRRVDVDGADYDLARRYMTVLSSADLTGDRLDRLRKLTNLSGEDFGARYRGCIRE